MTWRIKLANWPTGNPTSDIGHRTPFLTPNSPLRTRPTAVSIKRRSHEPGSRSSAKWHFATWRMRQANSAFLGSGCIIELRIQPMTRHSSEHFRLSGALLIPPIEIKCASCVNTQKKPRAKHYVKRFFPCHSRFATLPPFPIIGKATAHQPLLTGNCSLAAVYCSLFLLQSPHVPTSLIPRRPRPRLRRRHPRPHGRLLRRALPRPLPRIRLSHELH